MKIIITNRNTKLHPDFEEWVEKKLSKLDKFFDENAIAEVTVVEEHNQQTVEITIRHSGMIFRAEDTADDALTALDKLVDILLRQIRKNKTRLEKKLREDAFKGQMPWSEEEAKEENDSEYKIVRTKKFAVKPMDVEEAILQMNMLGHQFFMFRNMDSDEINVVYARHNGDYGLLEPNE